MHDTGIRWTVAPIQPVVDLLKNTEIFPKVRSFVLKALYVFAKEGDRVLGLISEVCVSTCEWIRYLCVSKVFVRMHAVLSSGHCMCLQKRMAMFWG